MPSFLSILISVVSGWAFSGVVVGGGDSPDTFLVRVREVGPQASLHTHRERPRFQLV